LRKEEERRGRKEGRKDAGDFSEGIDCVQSGSFAVYAARRKWKQFITD